MISFSVGCFLGSMLNFRGVPSLKLSAKRHLKPGWMVENIFSFPFLISTDFRGASTVSFRECSCPKF